MSVEIIDPEKTETDFAYNLSSQVKIGDMDKCSEITVDRTNVDFEGCCVGSGAGGGNNVAVADLTADANHSHDMGGFSQTYNSISNFNVNSSVAVDLDSSDGTDDGQVNITPTEVTIDVNLAAGPLGELVLGGGTAVLNAEDDSANDASVRILPATVGASSGEPTLALETAGVDDGTALDNMVLVTTDAATGEAEWAFTPMFVPDSGVPATPVAGAEFYASGGEMFVIDSGGNSTQLSPHKGGDEWVFYSENKRTGKRIEIDVERFFKEQYPQYIKLA